MPEHRPQPPLTAGGLRLKADGWMQGVRRLPSDHFNARPEGTVPDLVILHYISLPPGEFGTGVIERFFQGTLGVSEDPRLADLEGVRVSSHFLISRTGDITQFVSTRNRAWHAGVSSFEGRSGCNDFSVGIELEGSGEHPFEEAQYDSLVGLLAALQEGMGFTAVTGHEDVAPGRKADPGPFFDWKRLEKEASRFGNPRIAHGGKDPVV